jgi:hypothetical protein
MADSGTQEMSRHYSDLTPQFRTQSSDAGGVAAEGRQG